jgi:ribosomal 30S subunit maturation factor RimM
MTEYFKIGKIVASFGLKGEVILKHNLGKKSIPGYSISLKQKVVKELEDEGQAIV